MFSPLKTKPRNEGIEANCQKSKENAPNMPEESFITSTPKRPLKQMRPLLQNWEQSEGSFRTPQPPKRKRSFDMIIKAKEAEDISSSPKRWSESPKEFDKAPSDSFNCPSPESAPPTPAPKSFLNTLFSPLYTLKDNIAHVLRDRVLSSSQNDVDAISSSQPDSPSSHQKEGSRFFRRRRSSLSLELATRRLSEGREEDRPSSPGEDDDGFVVAHIHSRSSKSGSPSPPPSPSHIPSPPSKTHAHTAAATGTHTAGGDDAPVCSAGADDDYLQSNEVLEELNWLPEASGDEPVAAYEADEDEDEDPLEPYHFIKTLPALTPEDIAAQPILLPPKLPNMPKITLALDLDETLLHSECGPIEDPDHVLSIAFDNCHYDVFVKIRPHLEPFLKEASRLFEVVIFTASHEAYAKKVLDLLDPHNEYFHHRLFRQACLNVEGNYLKELHVLGRPLEHIVIIDNSPQAFGYQIENGVPITSWFDDPSDKELLQLIPLLRHLASEDDVRPCLARAFGLKNIIAALPTLPLEDPYMEELDCAEN